MTSATIPLVFFTSLGVGFSGAISPGPLLVYNIGESVRRGFMAGPLVSLGHALLELVVVVGLALGVSKFLNNDVVFAVVGFLGGLFLLWMGLAMVWKSKGYLPLDADSTGTTQRKGNPILGGILVSLSNPFWTIWWLTIGLGYLLWARDLGVWGVAAFYVGHIMSDLVWYSLVSFGVASGRRFLMAPKVYQGLIVVCGLFLLALGGYFIANGAHAALGA